jgi:hypothetical protein
MWSSRPVKIEIGADGEESFRGTRQDPAADFTADRF